MTNQKCECELCTATWKVLDAHSIKDPELREHIRELADVQAHMLEVMDAAEEAGYDLDTPMIDAILDEIFSDEVKPTIN